MDVKSPLSVTSAKRSRCYDLLNSPRPAAEARQAKTLRSSCAGTRTTTPHSEAQDNDNTTTDSILATETGESWRERSFAPDHS